MKKYHHQKAARNVEVKLLNKKVARNVVHVLTRSVNWNVEIKQAREALLDAERVRKAIRIKPFTDWAYRDRYSYRRRKI